MAEEKNKKNEATNNTGKPEEGKQPENNNGGAENPPAVNPEKKGIFQTIKDKKQEFVTNHPVAARRIRKGVDIVLYIQFVNIAFLV